MLSSFCLGGGIGLILKGLHSETVRVNQVRELCQSENLLSGKKVISELPVNHNFKYYEAREITMNEFQVSRSDNKTFYRITETPFHSFIYLEDFNNPIFNFRRAKHHFDFRLLSHPHRVLFQYEPLKEYLREAYQQDISGLITSSQHFSLLEIDSREKIFAYGNYDLASKEFQVEEVSNDKKYLISKASDEPGFWVFALGGFISVGIGYMLEMY